MLKETSDLARTVRQYTEVNGDLEARVARLEKALVALVLDDNKDLVWDIARELNRKEEFALFVAEDMCRKKDE